MDCLAHDGSNPALFDPTLALINPANEASYSRNVQPLIDRDGCPVDFNIMHQPLKEIHPKRKARKSSEQKEKRTKRAAELILAGGKKRRAPGPGPHSLPIDGAQHGRMGPSEMSKNGAHTLQQSLFEESRLYSSFKVQKTFRETLSYSKNIQYLFKQLTSVYFSHRSSNLLTIPRSISNVLFSCANTIALW